MEKVAIIGGYGGMGRIFAKLFKDEGFDVAISGPTESKGEKAAAELGAVYERDNKKAAERADIVIVAVPIESTLEVIKEVAPEVRKEGLLMDLTSVKEKPCEFMEKHAKKEVEVVGCHPIFGPRVREVDGQVLVLTPVRGERGIEKLRKIFERHNCKVFETTPEEHDRTMAIVQGLTHFSYISFGKTLQEMDFDIKESRKFSSPIYELMLDMVGRIVGQDPHLYAQIQMQNPYVSEVHKKFLKTAGNLQKVVSEKDEKKFVEMMVESAKHFDDVDRAMGRSDKAIAAQISELNELKDSVGSEICLRHIYSGQVHLGTVKKVTPEEVNLEESGKTFTLKLSNVQVLSGEERIGFKREKFGTLARDFSIVLDSGADEKFISRLLKEHDEDLINVSIKDVYESDKLGKGRKSVCFGVEFINQSPKEKESDIKEFFTKIGGRTR